MHHHFPTSPLPIFELLYDGLKKIENIPWSFAASSSVSLAKKASLDSTDGATKHFSLLHNMQTPWLINNLQRHRKKKLNSQNKHDGVPANLLQQLNKVWLFTIWFGHPYSMHLHEKNNKIEAQIKYVISHQKRDYKKGGLESDLNERSSTIWPTLLDNSFKETRF